MLTHSEESLQSNPPLTLHAARCLSAQVFKLVPCRAAFFPGSSAHADNVRRRCYANCCRQHVRAYTQSGVTAGERGRAADIFSCQTSTHAYIISQRIYV